MADEKTTQLADAETLTGAELIGIVQSGTNVQTTSYYVSNFVNTRRFVQMGLYSNGGGETGVAIGYYATALGPNPIAIGSGASSTSQGSISIGYNASTSNTGAIAIGSRVYNHGDYSLGVGNRASANGHYSIAVGAYANAEANCIAIGAYAKGYDNRSIAIGVLSKGYGDRSIAVGYRARAGSYGAIAIGYNSYAVFKSVALGVHARTNYSYCVAIGVASECIATYSIAIGPYTYTVGSGSIAIGPYCGTLGAKAVAIGAYTRGRAAYSVAIGARSASEGQASFALGAYATAAQDHSMVIGSSSTDVCMGSLVISGVPVDFALRPCEHYQKFVGQTIPSTSASVALASEGFSFTVTYATPGTAGNGFFLSTINPGPNNTLSVALESNTIIIFLGTDGDGNLDPSQNTLANFASLFPADGFTFSFTGPSDSVFDNASIDESFTGGVDGSPSVILTADGNSPAGNNTPAMWSTSIATLTGRVTGAGNSIFSSSDDAACFVLSPLLLFRDDEGIYNFIGTPTFTLENNTEGAADWDVPTLSLDGDTGYLDITVVNNVEPLNWMAHFKFETSQ